MSASRKRPRKAKAVARAGDLAVRAIAAMVPSDQIRLARVQVAWGTAIPSRLQSVAWPASVRGDTLLVHVQDNQWLHELSYLRADVIARLQAAGIDGVSDLRLRVGTVEHLPPPPTPPSRRAPILDPEPASETIAAMADVHDDDLRQAIAKARLALGRS